MGERNKRSKYYTVKLRTVRFVEHQNEQDQFFKSIESGFFLGGNQHNLRGLVERGCVAKLRESKCQYKTSRKTAFPASTRFSGEKRSEFGQHPSDRVQFGCAHCRIRWRRFREPE